jgi:predicted DNA-binding antitoxin AbrB/MazE fold protein
MSAQTCEAVYENGVLRPTRPLTGLKEGESVSLTVTQIITDPEELQRRHEEML